MLSVLFCRLGARSASSPLPTLEGDAEIGTYPPIPAYPSGGEGCAWREGDPRVHETHDQTSACHSRTSRRRVPRAGCGVLFRSRRQPSLVLARVRGRLRSRSLEACAWLVHRGACPVRHRLVLGPGATSVTSRAGHIASTDPFQMAELSSLSGDRGHDDPQSAAGDAATLRPRGFEVQLIFSSLTPPARPQGCARPSDGSGLEGRRLSLARSGRVRHVSLRGHADRAPAG